MKVSGLHAFYLSSAFLSVPCGSDFLIVNTILLFGLVCLVKYSGSLSLDEVIPKVL